MKIEIKGTQAEVYKIYFKRAMCVCPFHTSKKGGADLDITIEGPYTGKFYCYGCGASGRVSDKTVEYLRSMRTEDSKPTENKNWAEKAKDYQINLWQQHIQPPFDYISPWIWTQLGLGWDGKSWTVPMRNEKGEITGINRRFPDGNKGNLGKLGLIIPKMNFDSKKILYVTEGMSDLVCILECGFQGIARPNCNPYSESIIEFVSSSLLLGTIVIVADKDAAGWTGADYLNKDLKPLKSKIICPEPYNDLRQFFEAEGKDKVKEWLNV